MKSLRTLTFGLFVLAGLLGGGCEPIVKTADTKIWCVSDMVALTDKTKPFDDTSIVPGNDKTIELFAAANETISFQIVIDAPPTGTSGVKFKTGTLRNSADNKELILSTNTQIYRMLPVKVDKFPAWHLRLTDQPLQARSYYDILVPTEAPKAGQPYNLGGSERLAAWVDISIPRNAKPGTYTGRIVIEEGSFNRRAVPISLEVYDFVLPDARPLAAVGGFGHETLFARFLKRDHSGKPYLPVYLDPNKPKVQKGLRLVRQLMLLGHEHRLDLFDKQIRPKIRRNNVGKMQLDWQGYDVLVKPYITGEAFADKIGVPAWPIPFSTTWPVPKYYGGLDSETYAKFATEYVAACGKHFRSLGAEEQMFAWPLRNGVSAGAFKRFSQLAGLIKQADSTLPVLSQLPTTPPKLTGWTPPAGFAESLDILAPPAQWLDPAEAKKRRKAKMPLAGVWLAQGQPPYIPSLSLIASPADVRAMPWFAMKYGCAGMLLPEVLDWSAGAMGSETCLFYPGNRAGIEGVLPSARLKRLRRGMQDIAYVWILQQRQYRSLAKTILDAMARYAGLDAVADNYLDPRINGWVAKADTWIQARRLLAEEVQAAVHPKSLTEQQKIASRVRWKKFTNATQHLRMERVRTTMRMGKKPPPSPTGEQDQTKPLQATILVDLFNEFGRTLDCKLEVLAMPYGWRGVIKQHRIIHFPPRQRRTAKLVVEGMQLPLQAAGKIPVDIKVTSTTGEKATLITEVPFIIAGQFNKTPKIDGDLSEWPTRPGATAGDFTLLGRRGQHGSGLARQQTVVQAMQDDKYLYFGIRCMEANPDKLVVKPHNTIKYDQLIARNEDIVEILLDPSGQAKGPQDLYHLAIKPNGVMIQERGIRSNPPLGKVQPLDLGAEVAIGKGKGKWVVELKIPRESFGKAGKGHFWGVNFTRYSTAGMEPSSWTGAARYFYDPQTLGTMFVKQDKNP